MKNVIITIARGFGSGGKDIGVRLSKLLDIPCYEKEILSLASDKSGISKELFEETDERVKISFLRKMVGSVPVNYKVEPSDRKFIHDNNLFHLQREVIEELAKTESCIISGSIKKIYRAYLFRITTTIIARRLKQSCVLNY